MNKKKPYNYKALKVYGRRIDEHRYVMEQHLGRYLRSNEIVRHKDGDTFNNHLSNLYIVDRRTQVQEQINTGNHHSVSSNPESRIKSAETCREKFGKRVMICSKDGNELMSVVSMNVAKSVAKCSGSASFSNGNIYETKNFILKLMTNEPNPERSIARNDHQGTEPR